MGFWEEEVPPSPKVHDQEVGLLEERSVKLTVNGAGPEVGVPEKLATGAVGQVMVIPTTEKAAATSPQSYP